MIYFVFIELAYTIIDEEIISIPCIFSHIYQARLT